MDRRRFLLTSLGSAIAAASPAPEAARRFLQNPTIPLDLKELEVAAPAPSSSSPAPCSSPTERGSRS
jgi:hypothetical protein